MEGISHEVCSLAGTLRLSKLVVLYDDNGISIDGKVEHWFADDTAKRFEAYGWNVIRVANGHDVEAVDQAIKQAHQLGKQHGRPTLIACRTVIGQGAPTVAGTDKVHGAPLGAEEIAKTRAAIGWPYAPFEIPAEVYAGWDQRATGAAHQAAWQKLFAAYSAQFPSEAAEFTRRMAGGLPVNFAETAKKLLADTNAKAETIATRKASQLAITALVEALPEMLGGSADLTGSNFTDWKGAVAVRAGADGIQFGRHINYGVREFGMAAIMNGVALHGGYLPFGGTFLTFSDYSRNALRMAALMKQRVVHVFTHDSIGLGEDGPTHQSIEHASSLRLIPNLSVWRPCDTVETTVAWLAAVERPASLVWMCMRVAQLPCCCRVKIYPSLHVMRRPWPRLHAVAMYCKTLRARVPRLSRLALRSRLPSKHKNTSLQRESPSVSCPCRAPMCSTSRMQHGVGKSYRKGCRA